LSVLTSNTWRDSTYSLYTVGKDEKRSTATGWWGLAVRVKAVGGVVIEFGIAVENSLSLPICFVGNETVGQGEGRGEG
jgi:hypothetical protein